jgi:tryptophan synthase alpha chain
LSRLRDAFARAAALVAYLPVGDPAVPPGLARVYAECGVDVVELGVPARDPFLDGETIAASMARAADVDAVAAARAIHDELPAHPLVWMGYRERPDDELARDVLASGVDALLVPEPAARLGGLAARIPLVPFVGAEDGTPPPPGPYVMVQAARGLTGVRPELGELAGRVAELRAVGAPLVVGFGISTGDQVRAALALGADGVVVGSALVEAALDGEAAVRGLLAELREALDRG